MTVMVLERAPRSLRGLLSRWMLELKPGVFVGTLNKTVREALWARVRTSKGLKAAWLIHRAACEQRFTVEMFGNSSNDIANLDGLLLIRKKRKAEANDDREKPKDVVEVGP